MGRLSEALQPETFGGATFNAKRDKARLTSQLQRVHHAMSLGGWWSLSDIAQATGGSEAGVSARLRDLRKSGQVIEKKNAGQGLWLYRMVTKLQSSNL